MSESIFLPKEKYIFMLTFIRSVIIGICLICDHFENVITYNQIRMVIKISLSDRINISCIGEIGFSQLFRRFLQLLQDTKQFKLYLTFFTHKIFAQIITSGFIFSLYSSNGSERLDSIPGSLIDGSAHSSNSGKNCTASCKEKMTVRN